jgi:hypothetical protein
VRHLSSIVVVLLAGLLAGCASSSTKPLPACGRASTAARYALDNSVVRKIYNNERGSPAVSADLAHVTGASDLLTAVTDDDQAATLAAVKRIVYTPGWHIVRLRVLNNAGVVLADVGGPYVLAPVSGSLLVDGVVVGTFVMSVQDDNGYKKLVTNIADLPVELYLGGKPLMGSLADPPSTPPSGKTLTLGGVDYDVDAYSVEAFPSGELQVVVLIPIPPLALDRQSCAAIRLATEAGVVARVAAAFGPHQQFSFLKQTGLFVTGAEEYTPGPIFVLNGATEVAGSNQLSADGGPPPPKNLPQNGSVTYEAKHWLVYSFAPFPPDRIYLLQPA